MKKCYSQGGEEYPAHSKKTGRLAGLVTSCIGSPRKTYYRRKAMAKDRSDGKTRKKT